MNQYQQKSLKFKDFAGIFFAAIKNKNKSPHKQNRSCGLL